jgi:hypothetical protein
MINYELKIRRRGKSSIFSTLAKYCVSINSCMYITMFPTK